MDPSLLFRLHDDGRVERFRGTAIIPASVDPATGVASKDITIDADTGVSARLYLPCASKEKKKLPILVYYHGGGFVIESPFSPLYHPYLNSLASKANVLVVSVNYRLAPEHKLPAAYDDSWTALNWAFSPGADQWLTDDGDFDHVFIGGDSAGGNIAHNVAMRAGDAAGIKIEGMALVHPFFWGTEPVGSETRDPEMRGWFEGLWTTINPGVADVDDPRLNATAKGGPGLAGLGCRKVMVAVAEKDVLAARGRDYYEALKGSGWDGELELFESAGEDHVFHLMKPESEMASEFMDKLVGFFKIHE